jgi:co-chaperonin GroES (HSP10)
MHIEPLRDFCFVEPDADAGEDAAGLIAVVRNATPPAWRGTVRAVGPDVRDLAPGVRVVMSRLQGIEVAGGVLLPEAAVLGTLAAANESTS